jgi:GH25 family lysozyme M1 (1,4-beta-N-acetylmuramidase)
VAGQRGRGRGEQRDHRHQGRPQFLGALGLPGQPVSLVSAIDVSTAQLVNLADYIRKGSASHVVVKLYQTVEIPSGRPHAMAQIQSALNQGCSVSGYVWGYRSVSPVQAVQDAIGLAQSAGVALKFLWIDCETYQGSTFDPGPDSAWLRAAGRACLDLGVRPGIYTGQWWWEQAIGLATQEFASWPLWLANYNFLPDLTSVKGFGGMEVVAHQWTSSAPDGTGLDRSVFRSDFL